MLARLSFAGVSADDDPNLRDWAQDDTGRQTVRAIAPVSSMGDDPELLASVAIAETPKLSPEVSRALLLGHATADLQSVPGSLPANPLCQPLASDYAQAMQLPSEIIALHSPQSPLIARMRGWELDPKQQALPLGTEELTKLKLPTASLLRLGKGVQFLGSAAAALQVYNTAILQAERSLAGKSAADLDEAEQRIMPAARGILHSVLWELKDFALAERICVLLLRYTPAESYEARQLTYLLAISTEGQKRVLPHEYLVAVRYQFALFDASGGTGKAELKSILEHNQKFGPKPAGGAVAPSSRQRDQLTAVSLNGLVPCGSDSRACQEAIANLQSLPASVPVTALCRPFAADSAAMLCLPSRMLTRYAPRSPIVGELQRWETALERDPSAAAKLFPDMEALAREPSLGVAELCDLGRAIGFLNGSRCASPLYREAVKRAEPMLANKASCELAAQERRSIRALRSCLPTLLWDVRDYSSSEVACRLLLLHTPSSSVEARQLAYTYAIALESQEKNAPTQLIATLRYHVELASDADDELARAELSWALGQALYRHGRFEESVEALRASLASKTKLPHMQPASILAMRTLLRTGQEKAAQQAFAQWIARFGASASAQMIDSVARELNLPSATMVQEKVQTR